MCYTCSMPQLNFYVPEPAARVLRERVTRKGVPLSKYLATLVLRETGPAWPRAYFENAVGFWQGPFERPSQGVAERRESL